MEVPYKNNETAALFLKNRHPMITRTIDERNLKGKFLNELEHRLFLMCVYLAYKADVTDQGTSKFIIPTLLNCPPVARSHFQLRNKSYWYECCGIFAPADVIHNHYEIAHEPINRAKCFNCNKYNNKHASDCLRKRNITSDMYTQKIRTFLDDLNKSGLYIYDTKATKSATRTFSKDLKTIDWSVWDNLVREAMKVGYNFDREPDVDWKSLMKELKLSYKPITPRTMERIQTPVHEVSYSPMRYDGGDNGGTSPSTPSSAVAEEVMQPDNIDRVLMPPPQLPLLPPISSPLLPQKRPTLEEMTHSDIFDDEEEIPSPYINRIIETFTTNEENFGAVTGMSPLYNNMELEFNQQQQQDMHIISEMIAREKTNIENTIASNLQSSQIEIETPSTSMTKFVSNDSYGMPPYPNSTSASKVTTADDNLINFSSESAITAVAAAATTSAETDAIGDQTTDDASSVSASPMYRDALVCRW